MGDENTAEQSKVAHELLKPYEALQTFGQSSRLSLLRISKLQVCNEDSETPSQKKKKKNKGKQDFQKETKKALF